METVLIVSLIVNIILLIRLFSTKKCLKIATDNALYFGAQCNYLQKKLDKENIKSDCNTEESKEFLDFLNNYVTEHNNI